MKIKLRHGTSNREFRHRNIRYFLEAEPKVDQLTLGEAVVTKRKVGFIFGRVSLFNLASPSPRIKKEYPISDYFFDKAKYSKAVEGGFEVQPKSNTAARLLLKAELAELVQA